VNGLLNILSNVSLEAGAWREWRVEVAQTMYTHVNKCKNDKIKGQKKNLMIRDFNQFLEYMSTLMHTSIMYLEVNIFAP
jgi:predicted extracellular nuclease